VELDKEEINLDSSLIDDLGMESVDLVNINAKIEKEFNTELPTGELWNLGRIFANEGNVKEGKITKKGVKRLREEFPSDDFQEVKPGASVADIMSLIKVQFIVDYIVRSAPS